MTNNNRLFVYLLIIIFVFINFKCNKYVSCAVYLRARNERGPDAWQSGVDCLSNVSHLFLYDPMPSRAKNCVIMHTSNMSTPAYDIETIFMKSMNDFLINDKFQG